MRKKFEEISVKAYKELGLYPVYAKSLYNGHEPLKIVGIRKHEVELEGDFSGGTNAVNQKAWFDDDEVFIIKKNCEEQLKANGCQLPNVHCCGGGKRITSHVEYWKEEQN